MAKIFRTEELSVNGDNIRISAESGNLIFKDGSGNLVTSTDIRTQEVSSLAFKDVDLDSDVSSLKSEISNSVSDSTANLDSDISSLQAQRVDDEATNDSDISSLQAQRVADEAGTDSDISSLQAQRVADEATNDSDISSLHALAAENDVRINNVALATSDGDSKSVTFSEAFPAGVTPAVVGLMKAGSGDPILGVQLSAVSNTGATFQFSDDIPADNTYTLVVMASA